MKRPKFSVVTPSLNQGIFIEDAIRGVQSQRYPSLEHIIVDGGSTDRTLEVLASYPQLRWSSESDKGQSDAINKGFQAAEGDIVSWCNTDDYYLPGAFESVVKAFEASAADVVYGEIIYVTQGKELIRHKKEHRFDAKTLLYYGCYIPSTSTFFSRRVIDDGELLDVDLKVAMDYEYFLRLASKGYKFVHVPQPLAAFRLQETNAGKRYEHLWRGEVRRVQDRHGAVRYPTSFLTASARSILRYGYKAKRQFLKLSTDRP